MLCFDLSFRSILIEEIFEDEGALLTKGSISWLSIDRGSYHDKRVQVVDGDFLHFFGVLFGAVYCWSSSRIVLCIWLPFCVF